MRRVHSAFLLLVTLCLLGPGLIQAKKIAKENAKDGKDAVPAEKSPWQAATFAGLELRGIGPALTSGRIADLAVDPEDPNTLYVAAAAGGVFKTTNHGTTWTPLFDAQGSSSIGCITLDPNNPNVVWVGTGENNSQRSVGYGDGVYKSLDGGTTWRRMGLENSEHIGRITVDPRDSKVVYVAAQGPLWSSGGDRGLYKTTDGGESWQKVLDISENTGISEVLLDPRHPDTLFAVAYQRRRHVWTLIDGGPEAGIHKSTDGGATWRKLATGLPSGDLGRIGLALSPVDPDVVYAIVEAGPEAEGFYRSRDGGETWNKRSGYSSASAQYYQELFADPHDVDRVYSMDVYMQVSEDGGATWRGVGETFKHVDNHALWIDPENPDHLFSGCDGGLYETFDRGATWRYFANLPITQFYRLALSNDTPFYFIYGGTQDNFSFGGPSRTTNVHGIRNSDWFVTLGGDGFQPQVDPDDPNIVYSQWQHGNLTRFDRRSGEVVDIQPQVGRDEPPLVWNWDAALAISPHDGKRLFFGADRLFRTDDRGESWRAISGDLTRGIDRMQLEAMGRVWPIDAIARNRSTSVYGNLVTVDESPLVENLIYVGTDDGLVQVTEDGGESWRRIDSFPGVPERTYVNRVRASPHQPDTVFAAFNNHKNGDFAPYLLKSTDRGRSWTSIAGDLPARGSVYAIEEDPVRAGLLFVGTEFGAFFSLDGGSGDSSGSGASGGSGGSHWLQLTGGLPTVAIRDLEIHPRDGDLVLASFGRGFFVLDDLAPLREVDQAALESAASSFSVRDALAYQPERPLGLDDKSFLGDSLYTAPNPPFGAVITYYLKDGLETLTEARHAREKAAIEKGEKVEIPSFEQLRVEDEEESPQFLLTIHDADGHVVRRLDGPISKGFHRVAWDLRFPSPLPVRLEPFVRANPWDEVPIGPPVVPGEYSVTFETVVRGERAEVAKAQSFTVKSLGAATLPAADRGALDAFARQVADLQRAVNGADQVLGEATQRLAFLEVAIHETPAADPAWSADAQQIRSALRAIGVALHGDGVVARAQEPTLPGIAERIGRIGGFLWTGSAAPTDTQRRQYQLAGELFPPVLDDLRQVLSRDLPALEAKLEAAGAAWTPGRVPEWPRP